MRFIVPVKRDTHNWEIAMFLMETVKQRYLMEQGKKWKGVETKISYGDFSEGRDIVPNFLTFRKSTRGDQINKIK